MASPAAKAAKSKAQVRTTAKPSTRATTPATKQKASTVLNTAKDKAAGVNKKKGKGKNSGKNEQPSAATTTTTAQPTQVQSAPRPTYNFQTVPGNLYNEGIGNLVDLGNKYADNETIGGMVAGHLADTFATGANMGLAVQYNDAFLGSLGKYQGGLENLRTGNTSKLMAQEAGLARDLIGVQGNEARRLKVTEGEQDRLSRVTQGEQDRLGYRVQGEEDRKKLQEEGTQTLRLRSDARGAIRSTGSRFFG